MQSTKQEFIRCAYPVVKETVPLSSRGYNTNNKYPEVPPLMSDGRSITAAWQHDSVTNAKLIEDNNIKSNWAYRKYLTQNANQVMQDNFRESSNDTGYNSRFANAPNIQSNQVMSFSSPLVYSSVEDNTKALGHTTSDLKTDYLSREILQSRTISPAITQDALIRTLGFDKKTEKKE